MIFISPVLIVLEVCVIGPWSILFRGPGLVRRRQYFLPIRANQKESYYGATQAAWRVGQQLQGDICRVKQRQLHVLHLPRQVAHLPAPVGRGNSADIKAARS